MRMDLIIIAIITAASFTGGFFTRDLMKKEMTVNNIKSETYVTTTQDMTVKNYQAQIQATVIDTKGVYSNFSISVKDISNTFGTFQTNTNYTISLTNQK